ncbi:MAG: D-alanyl-D-alanine carboxypeptidase [Oscillospiraceae bacterium]|nr:D-alanyl-D-alanine carboxypeptidase [Oscillospiraceae bacterium]
MKRILAAFLSVMLFVLPVSAAAAYKAKAPEANQNPNLHGAVVSPAENVKESKTAAPKGTKLPAATKAPKENQKPRSNIETNLLKMIGKSDGDPVESTAAAPEQPTATPTTLPKPNAGSTVKTSLLEKMGDSNAAKISASPHTNHKENPSPAVSSTDAKDKSKSGSSNDGTDGAKGGNQFGAPAEAASDKNTGNASAAKTPIKENPQGVPEPKAESAVLMEKETGTILYEKNAHKKLEPASVTKVMTLLLITEAIEDGRLSRQDMVTVSGYAAGMGGSQVFLEEGEQMSVNDLLKAVAVASVNDAATALAEAVAGSEEAFVARMNERAKELGMKDSTFQNCTGLPAEDHVTSAYDIAVMSRQLLKCPFIREFTTIWMDSLRDGAFGLSNTNKLIRFYKGATGLKTGSTATALFCLSATAQRDGMELIAAVMKAPTSVDRFETAKSLLNYGFANYQIVDVHPEQAMPPVDVELGVKNAVQPVLAKSSRILVEKTAVKSLTQKTAVCGKVQAPVEKGQKLGEMVVSVNGQVRETIPVVASEAVPRLTVGGLFKKMTELLFMKEK